MSSAPREEGPMVGALQALGVLDEPHEDVPTKAIHAAFVGAMEAGALQLASLGQLATGSVRTKSALRDLVTEVDVASERLIVEGLRAATPEFAIEAEEEVQDALDGRPRWFVDPLDGTVNYVHGIPFFGVSVGLFGPDECGRSQPLFGLVHAPRLGETFVALRGRGAYCLRPEHPPRRLAVSVPEGLGSAVLATGFPYRRGELEHSNLENLQAFFYDVRGIRRLGSAALDLAYVAAGRLDGYWELHLAPHDCAAGAVLVTEAGGVVTDAVGGHGWLRGGQIVAAHGSLAPRIAERIVCGPL